MSTTGVAGGGRTQLRPRFGGRDSPAGWVFELSGGHPALDLANTLDERRTQAPKERLRHYGDLLDFAVQTGLIGGAAARRLAGLAAHRPAAAARCLRRVRSLREQSFVLFSAAVDRRRWAALALRKLNTTLARTATHRSLAAGSNAASWTFTSRSDALDVMLPPLAWAAAELLTSARLVQVRRCAGRGCAWLFLDASRNGSRRWCDMTVCGNRAKARRYRERLKGR